MGRAEVDELLVRCRSRLLTRIRWMMGEQARRVEDSGDFFGEVSARILARADSLEWRDENHFLALASRIAWHAIVDRVRRPRVKRFESFTANLSAGRVAEEEGTSPSQEVAAEEDIDRVLQALEKLSEDHQSVIELRHFEGLSFREVGERMGRAERAVQSLHARAVTALGRILAG